MHTLKTNVCRQCIRIAESSTKLHHTYFGRAHQPPYIIDRVRCSNSMVHALLYRATLRHLLLCYAPPQITRSRKFSRRALNFRGQHQPSLCWYRGFSNFISPYSCGSPLLQWGCSAFCRWSNDLYKRYKPCDFLNQFIASKRKHFAVFQNILAYGLQLKCTWFKRVQVIIFKDSSKATLLYVVCPKLKPIIIHDLNTNIAYTYTWFNF